MEPPATERSLTSAMEPPAKKRSLTRQLTVERGAAEAMMKKNQSEILSGTAFKNGSLLGDLARSHVRSFREVLPDNHKPMSGLRTWATLCSGSEGAHFVMQEVELAMGAWNTASGQEPLQLVQLFACESVAIKRKWIHHVVNGPRKAKGQKAMCIYTDILHMGQRTAFCETHDKECEIPGVDILLVSTSCKDLSLLSSAARNFTEPVLDMDTSPGGSADTFGGFLGYLDVRPASLIIYENSDQMVDDHAAPAEKTNEDVFLAKMSARFYECSNVIINAKLYGCPQTRRRFFAVCLRTAVGIIDFRTRTVFDQLRTMILLLQGCKRACPPALDLLLPDDDFALQVELCAMLEKTERVAEKPTWQLDHKKEYDKIYALWGAG